MYLLPWLYCEAFLLLDRNLNYPIILIYMLRYQAPAFHIFPGGSPASLYPGCPTF